MGHLVGKDIYQKLGKKIDGLTMRSPWNETLYKILKELYTEEEAELIVKLPYGLSSFEVIASATKWNKEKLKKTLNKLCSKGLVIDLFIQDKRHYMTSPMAIGIFEFTMMRMGKGLDTKKMARLFHEYLLGSDTFFSANLNKGQKVSLARALPHEAAVAEECQAEVLDYEKAKYIVNNSNKFSIGICSCRHEKLHVGEKKCDVALNSCTSFGNAADYLIRNKLAKEVSKEEMLERFEISAEQGLVFNADNVKKRVSFVCHCCSCCCNMLQGIKRFGYENTVTTSTYIAEIDIEKCNGCGKCKRACPVDAIKMIDSSDDMIRKKQPVVDNKFCLGCGICGLKCPTGAMKLIKRKQRVLHPETTFERVILQCLEQGTLQNQLFDQTHKITHQFMRAFLGAFLRLSPVKKALLSELLRSRFLSSMKTGAKWQHKGNITEV